MSHPIRPVRHEKPSSPGGDKRRLSAPSPSRMRIHAMSVLRHIFAPVVMRRIQARRKKKLIHQLPELSVESVVDSIRRSSSAMASWPSEMLFFLVGTASFHTVPPSEVLSYQNEMQHKRFDHSCARLCCCDSQGWREGKGWSPASCGPYCPSSHFRECRSSRRCLLSNDSNARDMYNSKNLVPKLLDLPVAERDRPPDD